MLVPLQINGNIRLNIRTTTENQVKQNSSKPRHLITGLFIKSQRQINMFEESRST